MNLTKTDDGETDVQLYAVPEGWALVPKKATDEIRGVIWDALLAHARDEPMPSLDDVWADLLTAARSRDVQREANRPCAGPNKGEQNEAE